MLLFGFVKAETFPCLLGDTLATGPLIPPPDPASSAKKNEQNWTEPVGMTTLKMTVRSNLSWGLPSY